MGEGLFPYSKRYLGTWDNHFSTIGLVGMNECCRNFLNTDLASQEGRDFALGVLDFMRERLISYQESTGNLYNLEATPAESTSYRLAKIDRDRHAGIITAGKEDPYYTNSTQLPVEYTSDLFHALDLQEEIQTRYTGGTVFHCFLGESIEDPEACKKLVKTLAENYRVPYYTISPTFSVCTDHGYLKGEQLHCSQCNKETEVYARIVGYYRPVKNWNKGKAAEYQARNLFQVRVDQQEPVKAAVKADSVKDPGRPADHVATLGKGVFSIPIFELDASRREESFPINGSSEWKLFTKPSCTKCDQVREELQAGHLSTEVYNLQESKDRRLFSQYYRQIREHYTRNTKGEMDMPILLQIGKDGQVLGWASGPQEIHQMLTSEKGCHPC
jgi:hypothetical protein